MQMAALNRVKPNVSKIAVLRASAIGDFVFSLPALTALKHTYPAAELVFLGQPWHADFLRERPGPVDRVEVVPVYRGVYTPKGCREDADALTLFFARMQEERFDLALQMHGGGRYSNPFVNSLGARLTAGARTPDAEALDRWLPYVREQRDVLSLLGTAALVGAMAQDVRPRLAATEEDILAARVVFPEMDFGDPLVVLNPGATDPRRRWPPEEFARVGDALARLGARIVINGGQGEEAICAAVAANMQTGARNLCGVLSLRGLLGLLSQSRLLVSNDTGPLHLAMAIGTPVVGIYWGFNLLTSGPMSVFRNRMFSSWQMTCGQCGHSGLERDCGHGQSFVASVAYEDVERAALELFVEKEGAESSEKAAFLAW